MIVVTGYALVMGMRRVLGKPIFDWIDPCVLALFLLLTFTYQADPSSFHRTGGRRLAGLVINYFYKFVVVCSPK